MNQSRWICITYKSVIVSFAQVMKNQIVGTQKWRSLNQWPLMELWEVDPAADVCNTPDNSIRASAVPLLSMIRVSEGTFWQGHLETKGLLGISWWTALAGDHVPHHIPVSRFDEKATMWIKSLVPSFSPPHTQWHDRVSYHKQANSYILTLVHTSSHR